MCNKGKEYLALEKGKILMGEYPQLRTSEIRIK